jgi:hypothetical protein
MNETTPARSGTTANAQDSRLQAMPNPLLEDRQSIADLMTGWIYRDLRLEGVCSAVEFQCVCVQF